MSADVAALRALAAHSQALADDAKGVAGRMRAALGVDFEGAAADRYRRDLTAQIQRTEGTAEELLDASRALYEHARNVEERLAQIAQLERWFHDRLSDAKNVVAGAAGAAEDAAGEAVDRAQGLLNAARNMPHPGSPDWVSFAGKLF